MNIFKAYKVLGVSPASTDEEIKAAHRSMSRKHHPDRDGGDAARFVEVQESFALIKDRKARLLLATRLSGLGRGCHACGNKGYTRKSTSFTTSVILPCETCDRAGYIEVTK